MTPTISLAYDCGQGNGKLVGPHSWAMLESYAALRRQAGLEGTLDGIGSKRARLLVELPNGQGFFLGRNAHAAGDPVEALDFERYAGAPEQRALFYGLLTTYMQRYQIRPERVRLTIGLPLGVLAGSQAAETVATVRGWLEGEHHWKADSASYAVTITEARVKSQAAGALYHYMYDAEGHILRERKNTLVAPRKGGGVQFVPVGILSFGFLTMEAMAVEYQRTEAGELELVKEDRFTASRPVGIHRLLEVARPGPERTLAELDQQLRDGTLETAEAMAIYRREVSAALLDAWGRTGWRRFGVILVVGGGAVTLGPWLLDRFAGRAFLPQAEPETNGDWRDGQGRDLTPILAIALGLYRQALRG